MHSHPPRFMVLLLGLALALPTSATAQDTSTPSLRGYWTLDVARSTFGPDGAPSAGTVRWTEHGWVLALLFPNGQLYADGVVTDGGCALIGVPAGFSCRIETVTPTRVRFVLLEKEQVRRVGDIELLDANTTRTTHRVTPASGAAYTETTFWTRTP